MHSLWRSSFILLFTVVSLPRGACAPVAEQSGPADVPPNVLRQLVICDAREEAVRLARDTGARGLVRSSLPLFQGTEIVDVLRRFFGQTMERKRLQELGETVAAYVRRQDVPVVSIHIPDIDGEVVPPGTVCLIVSLGRYGGIESAGHRFSTRESFLRDLGIQVGDEVRLSQLGAAIDWVNTNPFRAVEALIRDQGDGRAGLELQLHEQRPYRLVAAYDNYGTTYTGRSRYTAAVHAGNLWRSNHQLCYEFTRARVSHQFQGHTFDYRVPFRWRGYLVFDASYSAVRPGLAGSSFTAEGSNLVSSVRHVLHHRSGPWAGEFSAGVNFKAIRNDLDFSGAPYLVDGHPFQDFRIYQLSLTETLRRYDGRGSWWLALTACLSPGGVDARNDDAAFARSRTGAAARYGYATVHAQRLTVLPHDLHLYTKALGQLSTGRLLVSEQMWLGGAATLRGYPERTYPADAMWGLTQELRSPAWVHTANFLGGEHKCRLQVLSFVDAGRSYSRHATVSDTREPVLFSTGVGLRGNVGRSFDIVFDYGWPLRRSANVTSSPGGRGQIQARLFF